MRRTARSVLAGMAAAAGSAALLLLWSGEAGAEELTPPPAEVVASVPTFNGQPLESMRSTLETAAPVAVDVPAPAPTPTPAPFQAASTDPAAGATFNGQPIDQVRSQFEAPPAPVTPAPAQIDVNGGRHIVYSVSGQRVWLIEDDGTVSRTYLVSGKRGLPRPGEYRVYSKSSWSRSGSVRMRWMTRFAKGPGGGAIGFHEIPIDRRGRFIQSFGQLGTYRSHGCVRQHPDDALHLWNWAPVGTKVIVRA